MIFRTWIIALAVIAVSAEWMPTLTQAAPAAPLESLEFVVARLEGSPGMRALAERVSGLSRTLDAAEGRALALLVAPALERFLVTGARQELAFITARVTESEMGYQTARESFAGAVSAPAGHLKVAAIQYPIEGSRSLDATLAKMEAYVRQARAGGAGLVVFPELFVLDRVSATGALSAGMTERQQLARIAREETPTFFERAKQLARELDIAILAGSFPRELAASEGGAIVNTSLLAFPDGRVVMQDKLHLTPDEVAWGWKAGETLQVFDAPWGRSTILICYDSQFPSLSASLAQSAPEIILIPSMTGAKGLQRVRWSAQARAVEHHAFVVVTGTVEAAGSTQLDHSARAVFLSPQDAGFRGVLRQGPLNREAIVYSDLNLTQLRASRTKAGLYAGRDQVQRAVPVRVIKSE